MVSLHRTPLLEPLSVLLPTGPLCDYQYGKVKFKNNLKFIMELSIQLKVSYLHLEVKYCLFPLIHLFVVL